MKYKAICFDYGGVVTLPVKPKITELISEHLAIPLEKVREVYFTHNRGLNLGKLSFAEFWETVLRDLGGEHLNSIVARQSELFVNAGFDKQIVSMMKRLRLSAYKVGILSNNSPEQASKIHSAFSQKTDAIVVSCEVGYIKPDHEIFEILCKKLKVVPRHMIFIDDSPQSLSTAKAVGYQPILYQNYGQLKAELKQLGVW